MSYSNNLRIELITTGTQAGVWGTTTNTNLGTIIEDSIAGYTTVSVATANQAFTIVDGAADEARNAMIRLTTATGANFAVYAPPVSKQYVIFNDSAYTATIYNSDVNGSTSPAGTGVAIPAGKTMTVWSNATNFYFQNTHIVGTVVGNVTGNADTATTLVTNASITTPVITGTKEVRVAMGANNVDLATGNYFSKTISGTTTFTVSNVPASGTAAAFILDLTNGGSASITWFTNTRWSGGVAPTLSTSGRDILGFFTYDGGSNWNGLLLATNMS